MTLPEYVVVQIKIKEKEMAGLDPYGNGPKKYRCYDDYDPEGVQWFDCSIEGSVFQEQYSTSGYELDRRHRNTAIFGPWKKGPAPQP